ncbi:unnamed protein product, partial [Mesorhabditis spiculigera]
MILPHFRFSLPHGRMDNFNIIDFISKRDVGVVKEVDVVDLTAEVVASTSGETEEPEIVFEKVTAHRQTIRTTFPLVPEVASTSNARSASLPDLSGIVWPNGHCDITPCKTSPVESGHKLEKKKRKAVRSARASLAQKLLISVDEVPCLNAELTESGPLEYAVAYPPTRHGVMASVDQLTVSTRAKFGEEMRQFEFVGPPPSDKEFERLRVCSYNVLCQSTAARTMYLYRHLKSDPRAISWESRWPLLAQEFEMLGADVYGLQEVDSNHLQQYEDYFKAKGYLTYFKKRTADEFPDGCLLAFKQDRFRVEHYEEVEYFVSSRAILDKHQVGQVCVVRDLKTRHRLCFANTHLLFNEKRGDIKLLQLMMLFATINKIKKLSWEPTPLFIMGDMNMQPFSPLYRFITQARLALGDSPRHTLSGQTTSSNPVAVGYPLIPEFLKLARNSMFYSTKPMPAPSPCDDVFTHLLDGLASVYCHAHSGSLPNAEVSTFHSGVANPDFIFFSIKGYRRTEKGVLIDPLDDVRLITRLTLPTEAMLRRTLGCWPNTSVPSDHIPLLADFALRKGGLHYF